MFQTRRLIRPEINNTELKGQKLEEPLQGPLKYLCPPSPVPACLDHPFLDKLSTLNTLNGHFGWIEIFEREAIL